ncbi:MAG TPA: SagB/ThcOx family dehydrogenase [Gallionellaceae bacterium]
MKRLTFNRLAMIAWFALFSGAAGIAASANPEGYTMETIRLPQPRLDSSFSVERALQARRSVRDFSGAALSLDETGQLLWAAQGITGPHGQRTAPSAGALYPLEILLVAGNVAGLAPGVYRYVTAGHTLTPLAAGDRRISLAQAAVDQQWMQTAPAVIVFCAVEKRSTWKYGSRGLSYIHIEVGHAAQNVFLQAQALGLGAAVVGAFDETKLASVLQLPKVQIPLYLMPVGKPAHH